MIRIPKLDWSVLHLFVGKLLPYIVTARNPQ